MGIFQQTIRSLDPLLPLPVIGLWLIACLALTVLARKRNQGRMSSSAKSVLLILRLLLLLFSTLLLLQPMKKSRSPLPDSFRIAVLADCSRSMETADLPGKPSRIETLRKLLESPAMDEIAHQGELDLFYFSNHTRPAENHLHHALPVLPGTTDLAVALRQGAEGDLGAAPAGALLLLSDGHDTGTGQVFQFTKELAKRKIPVSCVAIGAKGSEQDLKIRFLHAPATAQRDEEFNLTALIQSSYNTPQTVQVELLENGLAVQTREIAVAAKGEESLTFSCSSPVSGNRTYGVRISPPPEDQRAGNNLDFTAVKIEEPDSFSFLYLTGSLTWEWRFLKIMVKDNPQLSLNGIIQTGPEQFFRSGLTDDQLKNLTAFPETTAFYANYDGVILDTTAASRLTEAGQNALLAFVERKGGGLLLMGDPALLPNALRPLLPVNQVEIIHAKPGDCLMPDPDLVFTQNSNPIFKTARGIPLPAGTLLFSSKKIKSGTRSAATLNDNASVLLAVQAYGAGRCAYSGTSETWKWILPNADGTQFHSTFWNCLLVWLGAQQQPQLLPEIDGQKISTDEPVNLKLFVSGTDFAPATDGKVLAILTAPDGEIKEIPLEPSAEETGAYSAPFTPELPGEYAIRWQAVLPEQTLATESAFLAKQTGPELENTAFSPETLQDIARITAGKFLTPEEFAKGSFQLPLSPNIPMRETTVPAVSPWLFLILLSLTLATEWYLRRNYGLR